MSRFVPAEDVSAFRRMAAAMWWPPRDPSIYGSMDLDATAPLAFLRAHAAATGQKLTVTHLVARAVALALRAQPELNAKVRFWGRIERRATVDLFVQVAVEGSRDLSGVRIERADDKPLAALARELAEAAAKVRRGADAEYGKSRAAFRRTPWWLARPALRLADLVVNELHVGLPSQGMPLDPFGSAMITSVGMFGIDTGFAPFTPIARCPIVVLIPEVRPRPWVVGDRVEVRPVLRLCATFDHRIIDGASAGALAARIAGLFAAPEQLA